jgi:TP901 family phage tail tape measure protein
MADETRKTQYLFEFAAAGVEATGQQFRSAIAQIDAYEKQLRDKMTRIDQILSKGTGGGAAPTVAIPPVDVSSIREAEQAILQAEQASSRLSSTLATAAGSQGQLKSVFTETRDGVKRVEETTVALGDQADTVVKSKEMWDAYGASLGTMTTTTRTLPGGIKETTVAIEGLNQQMRGGATFSEQFVRHLKWISQGIILWAGIGAVTDAIREWWTVQSDLNQSLAEFEMRTQASPAQLEQFRQGILSASSATGVAPGALAAVAPVAPDDTTLRYAAELQRVAGGDMQNQMQWLIAQQRQFGQAGEETVNILNAMASGWRLTTLPMSEFITMLRDAAPLSKEFNLSMEEMYSMFGALQAVTGAEGKELDYLVRNMSKLYDPQIQQDLGIQTTRVLPGGEVERRNIISVLDEVNQKIKDGEITVEEFAALFGATGRGQRQQIQRVMLAWDTFIQSMTNSMDTPAQWSNMFDTAMDTSTAKVDSLKSAWDRFLLALGDTEAVTKATSRMAYDLDKFAQALEGEIPWSEAIFSGYHYKQEQGGVGQFPTGDQWWLQGQQQPTGVLAPRGGYDPAEDDFEGVRELPSWPTQAMIPEGVDFSDVVRGMNEWVAAFSALGPEFENWINASMQSVLVYDENTRHLQMMNVFLPALQRAIAENTQAQKEKELQPGLRNVDLDLSQQGGLLQEWVNYYTNFLNQMGYPQEQQPQLVLGANDTFLRLWASNEALMLAIRALTEATEDQTDILSGMWNVPEGATMWVPIQSLFYSRQPGGGGGLPGGFPTPPPTLPEEQPDWMSLPGAVDSMTVNSMTVTNMEGITVDVDGDDQSEAISQMTEQQRILAEAIAAFREGNIDEGVPEPDWDRWAQALSNAITSFRERSGGVGAPEPPWSSMDLSQLIEQISITPSEIKASTLEIQSPLTEMTTPNVRATAAYSSVTSPTASMTAATVTLITPDLEGLPNIDTSSMEAALQTMEGTLQLILNSLQTMNVPVSQAPYVPENTPMVTSPTPNQVSRFVAEKEFWDFTNYSRMRSAF